MKVAIVGTAPSSRGLAPYSDPDWEIWACSPNMDPNTGAFCGLPRVDRFFELHKLTGPELKTRLNEEQLASYIAWLTDQATKSRVYMQEGFCVPGSSAYPLQKIVDQFGDYFTNTVSFMLAFAIQEGATEILIAGVDMAAADGEYSHQRPSCEYLLGFATGKGINVIVPKQADLLKTANLYAFEDPPAMKLKAEVRQEELKARIAEAKNEVELYGRNHAAAAAAAEEANDLKTLLNGSGTPELLQKIDERTSRHQQQAQGFAKLAHESREKQIALMGAEENNNYWRQW